jgi:hypothetical protein
MTTTDVLWPQPQPVDASLIPPDAIECWSVTSILRALYSYGLEWWKLQQVALTAYDRADALKTWTEDEAASILTKQSSWRTRGYELSDTECGSEVHRALERYVLDGTVPTDIHPEARPFVRQWEHWQATMRPTYTAVEATVYDDTYLYAGTLDAMCTLSDDRSWLVDYKTTRNDRTKSGHVRNPYPEWCLQLAAYRRAPWLCAFRPYVLDGERGSPRRYYIAPNDRANSVPMPQVDGCAILQLTPTAWRMYPVRVDEDAINAFLYVRGAQHFTEVTARRSVFGAYLEGTNE